MDTKNYIPNVGDAVEYLDCASCTISNSCIKRARREERPATIVNKIRTDKVGECGPSWFRPIDSRITIPNHLIFNIIRNTQPTEVKTQNLPDHIISLDF